MRRPRPWAFVVVLVLVAAGAVGACGRADQGPEVREIVVPLGTAERLARGEAVTLMPAELHFRVGDTLRIRNEDVADQRVGPYQVAAGEEFALTFGAPGRFEGSCPLAEDDHYEIVVTS